MSTAPEESTPASLLNDVWNYPFMEAVVNRRSRRFSKGATMPGTTGLAYKSSEKPVPLSTLEEAILVSAAVGMSGYPMADLPYNPSDPKKPGDGGGNVMATFNGRTGASADAVHGTALFLMNDEGTFLLKRPQDMKITPDETDKMHKLTHDRQLEEMYKNMRIQISDKRTTISREVPHVFSFNVWSTNLPGTTYFVPASDLTAMYLNLLLQAFDEETAVFMVDERNGYAPAGIAKFGKSRGGRLYDDLTAKVPRVGTIQAIETIAAEFMMAEQAFMGHNMMLAEQAMGLGGWSHFATARPSDWFEKFGFKMGEQRLAHNIGTGLGRVFFMKLFGGIPGVTPLVNSLDVGFRTTVLNLLGQNILQLAIPLGFEHGGEVLLKPFCPPYYKNMEEAVLAFIDYKKASIKGGANGTAWKDTKGIEAQIPWFSDQCIAATIAYADYVFKRYGQFSAYFGPFRMSLAHQAHHLDLNFYDKFYKPGAYTPTQANHMKHWHGE